MTNPHQREVAVFEAALQLPPEQRAAYLDQTCGGDLELRRRINALLKAHQSETDVLEPTAASLGSSLTRDVLPAEKPGDKIGPYKLLQQIGEGGCGVVYMAEQDKPIRRRVALKIIKLGMDTRQVVARFDAERQALALMDHPNIAKIYDAGVTERPLTRPADTLSPVGGEGRGEGDPSLSAGRPFFVMELARGVKITDYCDQNNLSTKERLDLFIQVCHAVQHAHQKGVIHRDLKPSNILVTVNDGVAVPKVIDFGIAKATQGRLTDQTVFTAFEQFIGTPAYMSPEQAVMTSVDIDTRSDIYSLGVLLYELLTGKTPFDQKELLVAGLDEMRRTIREKEPPRPSTCLSTLAADALTAAAQSRHSEVSKLIHLVRGDLDWIVMKCLEKDRARRYDTANGLAMDIQRHLNCEPVIARPPSKFYEFQKTVRRHKFGFAAGGAVMASLLVGLGISTLLLIKEKAVSQRAQVAETAAKEEAKRADGNAAQEALERHLVENKERLLRENLYSADIRLAQESINAGDLGHARDLLSAYLPVSGQEDLRSFEWRYLWKLAQGNQRATLRGHSNEVMRVEFSPDGKLLASSSLDGTVKLWDTTTWQVVATLPVLTNRDLIHFMSVSFSPDGRRLATGTDDGVKVWDLKSEKVIADARHTSTAQRNFKIAFCPIGNMLAIGDGAKRTTDPVGPILLWDLDSGKAPAAISKTETGPSVTFSHDGRILVTGGIGQPINLWSIPSGRYIRTLGSPGKLFTIFCLDISPDNQTLAIAPHNDLLEFYDIATGLRTGIIELGDYTRAVKFSPDGNLLATATVLGVRLWDVTTHKEVGRLLGHGDNVTTIAFSPDGKTLVTGSKDTTLMLWDVSPKKAQDVVGNGDIYFPSDEIRLGHPIFSPDGKIVAAETTNHDVIFWDVATTAQLAVFTNAQMPFAFSDEGRTLMTLDQDFSTIKAWDVRSGTAKATMRLPHVSNEDTNYEVQSGNVSPDGKILAFGCNDGRVFAFDTTAGKDLGTLVGLNRPIHAVALSPDNRTLAAAGFRTIELWDMTTHKLKARFSGHSNNIYSLAFSSDGKHLATAGADGTAKLWDIETCRELSTFVRRNRPAGEIFFSPGGRTLASAGEDKTIALYSLSTMRELITLDYGRPKYFVYSRCVSFSPDGQTLAAPSFDGSIQLWRAPYSDSQP